MHDLSYDTTITNLGELDHLGTQV